VTNRTLGRVAGEPLRFRGIEFRFASVRELIREIGYRPQGSSLDRIEADGHYELGNVRWATRSQQQRNKKVFKIPPRCRATGRFTKSSERGA